MSAVPVTCPGCQAQLRLPNVMPTSRVRCPRCKEAFEPVLAGEPVADEEGSESVAVVLDPTPGAATAHESQPPPDPDASYFKWLGTAADPLQKKPTGSVAGPQPAAWEAVEQPPAPRKSATTSPRPERKRESESEPERTTSGVGLLIALAILAGVIVLGGFAGAGYIAYKWLNRSQRAEDVVETAGNPGSAPAAPRTFARKDEALRRIEAGTVLVSTKYRDGQSSTASGFFVPGPGLIVTNARSVGQGRKPVPVHQVQATLGKRKLAAVVLGFDAELDLAVLQVAGLDLPKPVPLDTDTFPVQAPQEVAVYGCVPSNDGSRVSVNRGKVTGSRPAAGTRPWFVLGDGMPGNVWGGAVVDARGNVVGVAGVIPGTDTVAAVPAETVLAFIRETVKSAEASGPIAFAKPAKEPERVSRAPDDWPAWPPGFPRPGFPRPGLPPQGLPPGFPPNLPAPFPQGFPRPALPRPRLPKIDPRINPPPIPWPQVPNLGQRGRVPRFPDAAFPPVAPAVIHPAPLGKDRAIFKLPGKVADACIGGGGRFWFLSIPDTRQIAVFDSASATIVKLLDVGNNVKFAAGMEKLVVTEGDRLLARYSLKTFEKEATANLPIGSTVEQMALGSASGGPLFIRSAQDTKWGRRMAIKLFDLATLGDLTPGTVGRPAPMGPNLSPTQLRASPDGRVVTVFGGDPLWHVYTLSKFGIVTRTSHAPNIVVAPSDDHHLLSSDGVYLPDFRRVGLKDRAPVLRVPATQGPFYLTITNEPNPVDNPFLNPLHPEGQTKIRLNLLGLGQAIAAVPAPGVALPLPSEKRGVPGFAADRRVFFSPRAHLLAFAGDNDSLVLMRFDPEAIAAKSGIDYLYVSSRPPLAVRGTTYRYPLAIQSNHEGIKPRVVFGPRGARIEGTTLVWDVPQAGPIEPESIVVMLEGPGGQKAAYSFILPVSPR